jgi:hypothetical protein
MGFGQIKSNASINTKLTFDSKLKTSFVTPPAHLASSPDEKPNAATPLKAYSGTLFGRKFEASIIGDQASYLVYINETTAWHITAQKKDKILSVKDWSQGSYVHKELKRQIENAQKKSSEPVSNAVFMADLSRKWQKSQSAISGEQVPIQTSKPPKKANPIMQGVMGYQRTWAELYLGAGQFLVDRGIGQIVGINQKLLNQGRDNLAFNHYNWGGDKGSKAYGSGQGLGDVAISVFGGGMVGGGAAAVFPKAATAISGVLSNPILIRAGTVAATAQIIDGVKNNDARKTTSGVVSILSVGKIIQLIKQARSLPELMRLKKNAEIINYFSNPDSKQLHEVLKFVTKISAEKNIQLDGDVLKALLKGLEKNTHIAGVKEALAKLNPTGIVPVRTTQSSTGKAITVYNAKGANNYMLLARDLTKLSNIKILANAANQEIQAAINHIKAQITNKEHQGKKPKIDFQTLDAATDKLKKLEQAARNNGHTDYADILALRLKQYKSERTGLRNQVNYVRNEKDDDHSDILNTQNLAERDYYNLAQQQKISTQTNLVTEKRREDFIEILNYHIHNWDNGYYHNSNYKFLPHINYKLETKEELIAFIQFARSRNKGKFIREEEKQLAKIIKHEQSIQKSIDAENRLTANELAKQRLKTEESMWELWQGSIPKLFHSYANPKLLKEVYPRITKLDLIRVNIIAAYFRGKPIDTVAEAKKLVDFYHDLVNFKHDSQPYMFHYGRALVKSDVNLLNVNGLIKQDHDLLMLALMPVFPHLPSWEKINKLAVSLNLTDEEIYDLTRVGKNIFEHKINLLHDYINFKSIEKAKYGIRESIFKKLNDVDTTSKPEYVNTIRDIMNAELGRDYTP